MRYASLLPPLIIALTVAACARQPPAYYVTDARTGQRVATGQPQTSGYNSYATRQRQDDSDRGLFNSHVFRSSWFSRQTPAPTYAVQPRRTYGSHAYTPQTYSYQPPHQQPYAQRPTAAPYRQQQPATMQYRPPQPYNQPPQAQPTNYYAPRYRLY
ncbi:MAG: hypothetical protein P8Z80_08615 [Pseudolabrys sp.]|jgi:hypothetical protein